MSLRTLVWYTCMVHLCGTPVWYTCMVHLYGTPVWYTCMVHLYGTPVWYTCMLAENIVMAMDRSMCMITEMNVLKSACVLMNLVY